MTSKETDVKEIATQLLAGMLANPHIYSMVSEEAGIGQQEHILLSKAIQIAETLVQEIENSNEGSSRP